MNKNPFVPQPSYTPQQPPLPPGPPPPQPTQPDYSAYWAAAAAHHQQQQQPHVQPPTVGTYNPQWSVPQPPRPPAEQSALYANYGYGTQQNNHWQRQQHQQQQHQQYHPPPPPVVQPPPPPPAQPGYNPYQPTAGYPQQYVPQVIPPQPMAQPAFPHPPPQPQQHFFPQHMQPQQQQPQQQQPQHQHQQQQQQPRHIHHTPPQHLPPAKRQRFDGPNPNRHNQNQHHAPPPQPQFQPPPPPAQNMMGPYPGGPSHGLGRGGPPPGPGSNHVPMGGGGRGGVQNGRGGAGSGGRGGRGGPMPGNRGLGGRGRGGGGGSGYVGGGNAGGRGGGGSGGALRGHGSRGNFGGNKDYHNRRGGGSFTSGGGSGAYSHQGSSFRGRGQGHSNSNRGGRHDGGGGAFAARDGPMASSFGSVGKKDENRRTLTDFKIVGLEIHDLAWNWGILPSSIKTEAKEDIEIPEFSQVTVKNEEEEESLRDGSPEPIATEVTQHEVHMDDTDGVVDAIAPTAESKALDAPTTGPRISSDANPNSPPPSRIRIYFHTPVTADDSRPIPHNSSTTFSFGVTPSDSRKGKRKKLEDDDGDLEEGRARPPPPQMGSGVCDDRSSVAASVAPSVAETASEADWLMAAIVEGEEAEAEGDVDADGEEDNNGDDHLHVNHTSVADDDDPFNGGAHNVAVPVPDGNLDDVMDSTGAADHDGAAPSVEVGNDVAAPAETSVSNDVNNSPSAEVITTDVHTGVDAGPAGAAESKVQEEDIPTAESDVPALSASLFDEPSASASDSISSSQNDPSLTSASVEGQSADHVGYPDMQVPGSPAQLPRSKTPQSPQALSATSTLLDIDADTPGLNLANNPVVVINGNGEEHSNNFATNVESSQAEHLPEPPASPASNTLPSVSSTSTYEDSISQPPTKPEGKDVRTPSANRLSISYAGGNRRLVIDAEVVETLKVFRQDGRIEVVMNVDKEGDEALKGILMEGLSELTKSYLPLEMFSDTADADSTLPPFSKVSFPSSLTLIVHLDTARPLSEPKWAKSGDIQEWLKSMFGRMFWVAGDAAEGWEKKIQVVDPDPPPTIWTVLEGWAVNSPVGAVNERQRFLKTHMTETDNILEILLRLVRGERATPFSQSAPAISAPSVSGPLLSALSQGSAHGAQQTHVSLAVLALFRMTVEYAKKALGDGGKGEVEERVGEIIRCLPSHLIYKSLDGIFKEWRVDKKGR